MRAFKLITFLLFTLSLVGRVFTLPLWIRCGLWLTGASTISKKALERAENYESQIERLDRRRRLKLNLDDYWGQRQRLHYQMIQQYNEVINSITWQLAKSRGAAWIHQLKEEFRKEYYESYDQYERNIRLQELHLASWSDNGLKEALSSGRGLENLVDGELIRQVHAAIAQEQYKRRQVARAADEEARNRERARSARRDQLRGNNDTYYERARQNLRAYCERARQNNQLANAAEGRLRQDRPANIVEEQARPQAQNVVMGEGYSEMHLPYPFREEHESDSDSDPFVYVVSSKRPSSSSEEAFEEATASKRRRTEP